jgi:spoIIIJ-associated protein
MTRTEQAVEVTGSNVDAAIAAGLARLGIDRETAEIEVLDGGSRGVLGLGARDARVRLTPKLKAAPRPAPATPVEPEELAVMEKDEAEVSRGVLLELLAFLGVSKAQVDVRRAEHGPNVNALVGYRGETLAALQHVTRLIVGREMAGRVHLVVDVDGFKAQREKTLRSLAQRMAKQAERTGRTVVLEPMPPNERRIIHLTLRDDPHVTTQSTGEGDRRKVTVIPR